MRWGPLVLAMVALAGCNEGDGEVAEDACGASGYAGLVGENIAAVTLPAELNDRVLGPGDVATMDFDPTRLNVRVDAENRIVSLDCG